MARPVSAWHRVAAIVVLLTTTTGPLLVAFVDATGPNQDSSTQVIIGISLVVGAILLVIFLPAMVIIARYSLTLKSLVVATTLVAGSIAAAFSLTATMPDSAISIFVFPIAGVAAAVGAWAVNLYLEEGP